MPRESYDVRILRSKAIASLRSGIVAFNGLDDGARVTAVLLSVQHAFEMLLKAIMSEKKDRNVFDKRSQKAISLEAAIKRCQQYPDFELSEDEAGTIRAVDAWRDAEQHWHLIVDEGLLYLTVRAAVTLFDDLLERAFGQRLAEHLPARVLPISAEPPQDLDLLVDREYKRIAELLKPGRRATGEAKARIRSLLATEALADPDSLEISEADVRSVVSGIQEGKGRDLVFPKLSGLTSVVRGGGLTVEVRLVKKGGLPMTYTNDPGTDASVIRMVDLEKKFHLGRNELADAVGVVRGKAIALRRHIGIDANDDHYSHTFVFGKSKHLRYSDNAVRAMKMSLTEVIFDRVWAAHRPVSQSKADSRPVCDQPGCVTNSLAGPSGRGYAE